MSIEMRRSFRGPPVLYPLTDIVESDDGLHIFMDMPGVSKEDLQVELDSGELKIRGSSRYPSVSNEKYLEVEFGNCEYRRQFTLSDEIDRDGVKAVLKAGVLEIFLPKSDRSRPMRIEILGT